MSLSTAVTGLGLCADSLIFTISSSITNNNILWKKYITLTPGTTTYTDGLNIAGAYSSACNSSFVWNQSATGSCSATNSVILSILNPIKFSPLYIRAVSALSETVSSQQRFLPRFIEGSVVARSPSARYIQLSAKYQDANNTTYTLPSTWQVEWLVEPFTNAAIKISSTDVFNTSTGYLSGFGASALNFYLSSYNTSAINYKITGRIKYDENLSVEPRISRGTVEANFAINQPLNIIVLSTTLSSITARAYRAYEEIDGETLTWSIRPSSFTLSALSDSNRQISITASNANSFSQIYTYCVSSVTMNDRYCASGDGENFRPYRLWTTGNTLTTTNTKVYDLNSITRFSVKALGYNRTVGYYNVQPDYSLIWAEQSQSNVGLFLNDGFDTSYSFDTPVYSRYGDNVYIDILNDAIEINDANTKPQLVSRAFTVSAYQRLPDINSFVTTLTADIPAASASLSSNYFWLSSDTNYDIISSIATNTNVSSGWFGYVSAINPYLSEDGSYYSIEYDISGLQTIPGIAAGSTTFNLSSYQYISDSVYNPDYTFQYENKDAVIYRPLFSGTKGYTVFFENSTLAPFATNYIDFLINGNRSGSTVTTTKSNTISTFGFNVSASTPQICSISFNVTARYPGVNFNFIKPSRTTHLKFVQLPNASAIRVYPQYVWSTSAQQWSAVYTNPSPGTYTLQLSSPGTSAYGICHTENYLFSAADTSGSTYIWSISGLDKTLTVETSASVIELPIKSPSTNRTRHPVSIGIYTSAAPVGMPEKYYDTKSGTYFSNVYNTIRSSLSTDENCRCIVFIEAPKLTSSIVSGISVAPNGYIAAPDNLTLTSLLTSEVLSSTPFKINANNISWQISSAAWTYDLNNITIINSGVNVPVSITVRDDDQPLSIRKYETTNLKFTITGYGTLAIKETKPHPYNNDWCPYSYNSISSVNIVAYPVLPVAYTANRLIEQNENVRYENLIVATPTSINKITTAISWDDVSNNKIKTYTKNNSYNMFVTYSTTYSGTKNNSISLTHNYNNTYNTPSVITTDLRNITETTQFESYDPNVTRVKDVFNLELPYDVNIAPNEILTHDNINQCYTNVYKNLEYILDKSKIYDSPPTSYEGWLGALEGTDNVKRFHWRVNIPEINHGYNQPTSAIDYLYNNLTDVFVKDNIIYAANGTEVVILSSNFHATKITSRSYTNVDEPFNYINSIAVDSSNRIYLLDSQSIESPTGSKNRIVIFDYDFPANAWEPLYTWGGLGGSKAKYKFRNPQDLCIDNEGDIWVADTDNLCLKHYSRTGSWVGTYELSDFTNDSKPISIAQDSNNALHILLSNSNIIVINGKAEKINQYKVTNNNVRKIRRCVDGGFVYICCKDSVIKCSNDGSTQYQFSNNDIDNYNRNYNSCFHDEHRNFYIVSNNHILKYTDKLIATSLILSGTKDKLWSLNDILIKKQEYIQDWVINKSLNRLWDNIELVRRSIIGKFGYKAETTTTITSTMSTVTIPDNFNYCDQDWLTRQVMVYNTEEFCKVYPIIRAFTPDEYLLPPYQKDEIYVGINEFVTADVLNRCLKQLFDFINVLLEMISDSNKDRKNLCDIPKISNDVGACCLPDGSCRVITRRQCEILGGKFKGECIGCDGEVL